MTMDRPSTVPTTPLPVGLSKSAAFASARPRFSASSTMATASGCSLPRSRLAANRRSSSSVTPETVLTAVTDGLPCVSVPVLSTTRVSTFSMRSSASAFLISTPALAPRPTPTMIDIGVASPSAQGQAMISTVTAATSPNASLGSGPQTDQAPESNHGHEDHQRHEPAGDAIRQTLDRRPAALGIGNHLDDAGKHRVAADLLCLDDEPARPVDGPADDAVADLLCQRHRLARHHRLINGRPAFDD